MATNVAYSPTESLQRPVFVGKNVAPGTPLIYGGQSVVTITGSGDYISSQSFDAGDYSLTVKHPGGVGLQAGQATVAFDGSFLFNVAGITSEATALVQDGATLKKEPAKVYLAANGSLTATSTGNTFFGIVDFYDAVLGKTAVRIGVKEV